MADETVGPESSVKAIVGIGASAGGLTALKTLFAKMPAKTGVAFVVVVHLSPDHKSHLADLLQPHCPFPVEQVTATVPIEPDRVYVIPPNSNLNVIDTHLRLSELEGPRRRRAPIDHFFRTLAEMHDGHSIGVVLTGTGSDGTLGLRRIKERGGVTMVQLPEDAEYDGMPRSAIASGSADLILPLERIPEHLLRLAASPPRLAAAKDTESTFAEQERILQKIFAQIRSRTGHDFAHYKRSTLMRRIARRMQLHHVDELRAYLQLLRERPDEILPLYGDLLITVTEFFRDDDVFEVLRTQTVPQLFDRKGANDRVRIWSVGCSTGEEAYSLAMLLLEEASRRDVRPRIQIFASDLHEKSVARAREGIYPETIATDVSEERLTRFFVQENGSYRVRKEVRELIVFAPHDLLRDPPFSHLDLIVCRNVLIYLKRDAQRDVISLFHYALEAEGLLLLGTAETVEAGDLFTTVDKGVSIYRRRAVPPPEPRLPVFPVNRRRFRQSDLFAEGHPAVVSFGSLHVKMVEQYAPPSLLLGRDHSIVHTSANAGRYLRVPPGEATANVFKLLRDPLAVELRAAIHLAERGQVVRSRPAIVSIDGERRRVLLQVRPAESEELAGFLLVVFDEFGESADGDSPESSPAAESRGATARELDAELELAKQRLQAVIEEYETSQEEMQASNEELQSANEELRSTLEELETSKEELQSMNEELATLNQENRHRVDELSQLSADLQNLLASTNIATLFLDKDLRIVRFTPQIGELFNVRHTDRGRPLTDLTHRLGYDELSDDARRTLKRLVPVEREVSGENGRWFLCRILPYRTSDDRIDGVVITLIDISERRRAEEAERRIAARLAEELAAMHRLHDLVGRLLTCPDVRTALEEVLLGSVAITGAEMGDVQIFDPASGTLTVAAQRGFDAIAAGVRLETEIDDVVPSARALKQRERVVVEDVRTEPADAPHRIMAEAAGYRTVQATPLLSRDGEPLGALSTYHADPHRLTDRDFRLLDLYARQASDFIERVRAEEAARSLNDELETRVAERTAELQDRERRLKALAIDLSQAEQRERKRLAHVLHDDAQQALVAAQMRLSLIDPAALDDEARDDVKSAAELLRQCQETLRSLTGDLAPPALHERGLKPALEWLAGRMFQQHRLNVSIVADPSAEASAESVRELVFQVTRELLLNVVKHARTDHAEVRVEKRGGEVRLEVRDDGCGFDPVKAEAGTEDTFGLFHARERLRQAGGDLEIDSSPGAGSRAAIRFPAANGIDRAVEANHDPGERPVPAHGDPIRVLLVDDHQTMREGLARLLERSPKLEIVGGAGDGQQAIVAVRELRPQVVVMDVNMPIMNGIEATRRIKNEFPSVRVVGLSLHEKSDMGQAMLDAGAERYLSKGGPSADLFEAILSPNRASDATPNADE